MTLINSFHRFRRKPIQYSGSLEIDTDIFIGDTHDFTGDRFAIISQSKQLRGKRKNSTSSVGNHSGSPPHVHTSRFVLERIITIMFCVDL